MIPGGHKSEPANEMAGDPAYLLTGTCPKIASVGFTVTALTLRQSIDINFRGDYLFISSISSSHPVIE